MPVLRDLRYKLQQRKDNALKADLYTIAQQIRYLMNFVRKNPILRSISDELNAHHPQAKPILESMSQSLATGKDFSDITESFENEEEYSCFCKEYLLRAIDSNNIFDEIYTLFHGSGADDALDDFKERVLIPFYQYVDERVDSFNSVLYLIQKYKYSCEWFEREKLSDLYKSNESRGEANLDRDLRKFLFFQGIDYPFSSPLSASGRADVVAELDAEFPLVLEIKIFDLDKGYDRAYIRKGFRQAYDYANDYNQAIGYLFVFKTCGRDLLLNLTDSTVPQRIVLGNKTIFIIQADIYQHPTTSSGRKKLEPYVIEEGYLTSSE